MARFRLCVEDRCASIGCGHELGPRVRESRINDHQGFGLCDCSDGAIIYENGRTEDEQVHASAHLHVKWDIGNQEFFCERGTFKRPARCHA